MILDPRVCEPKGIIQAPALDKRQEFSLNLVPVNLDHFSMNVDGIGSKRFCG
jgi:hypothetical protein